MQNNTLVENVEVDLVDIFMDMNKQESNKKAKNKIKKKLKARRGIGNTLKISALEMQ